MANGEYQSYTTVIQNRLLQSRLVLNVLVLHP